jgi:hypothetical protein
MTIKVGDTVELARDVRRYDLSLDAGQLGTVLRITRERSPSRTGDVVPCALVDFCGIKGTFRLSAFKKDKTTRGRPR